MAKLQQGALKSLGDYFTSFEERAGVGGRNAKESEPGDASSGFCFAALVTAAGFMISAAANAAPF
ncbi:MAG: hypothetical protein PVI23_14850 [Maricaulaceae bacterium]|jgi:hypothetical protein